MGAHAHRQIKRCRNTEWYPISLFIGIPIVIAPVFFLLIVGDFGSAGASFFLAYGMISLLEKNLPIPSYQKRRHIPYVLDVRKSQNIPAGANAQNALRM